MSEFKEKERWWDRIREKRRIVSMDINNFSERWSTQLSTLNFITIIVAVALALIIGTYFLVAYTPIKEMMPDFPDGTEREQAIENAQELQELVKDREKEIRQMNSIKAILNDEIPGDTSSYAVDTLDVGEDPELEVNKSIEDSLLRAQMEEDELLDLEAQNSFLSGGNNTMSNVFFFTPLEGEISQSFRPEDGHFGVDIVAPENAGINSTLDGTVIFASWTSDAGHVIQIQHTNNLVSVYKHNSVLLKKVGDRVDAGEPIAIIGDSGEYSTGSHLHFELWQNGKPINPQQFINF